MELYLDPCALHADCAIYSCAGVDGEELWSRHLQHASENDLRLRLNASYDVLDRRQTPPVVISAAELGTLSAPATVEDARGTQEGIVEQNLATTGLTVAGLRNRYAGLDLEAVDAIAYYEDRIANWATLTADQKDRLLYNLARTTLDMLCFLTGRLS